MNSSQIIYYKLEQFIKKFYTNELIKGFILFIAIGLLYFIFTFLVEYFLWLSTTGRTVLFWLFIAVQIFLLVRFIAFPLFKLFKLRKGLNYEEASKIIGNHFDEVKDKLLNFLQLSKENNQNELLLASIEQKANHLSPIPFSNAINYSKNKKYLPYALVPLILLLLFAVSGNFTIVSQSFGRVVQYDKKFVPPAPFEFVVINKDLTAKQHQSFLLQVKIQGKTVPENAYIVLGNEKYFLQQTSSNIYEYTFENVTQSKSFYFAANNVISKDYVLKVVNVPTITKLEMRLYYPSYTGKSAEIIKGTGNAIVPEGTRVVWLIDAVATDNIAFVNNNNSINLSKDNTTFSLSKTLKDAINYQFITNNSKVFNYETLDYQISIVKDQHPFINVDAAPDSLKLKDKYVIGNLSDDYGLHKLQVVYYDTKNPKNVQRANLPLKNKYTDKFVYLFPSGLKLQDGVQYDYYFEVFDNDIVNNYKSAKSTVFSHYERTESQIQDAQLQNQNENINALEKSIQNQQKQLNELDKLQQLNKEKSSLDFKDQKKIEDFIDRQKQQEQMMKEFTKNLSENLEQFNKNITDKEKEELLRRLEEQNKKAEENEKLLKELEELAKKLQKEELFDKADKLKQNAKTQTKSLEQLVELTKKYYVEKKAEQIADKLNKLADKQEKLTKEDSKNTLENQKEVNKEFNDIKEELNQLQKDNQDLKSPLDIPDTKQDQQDVQNDLNKSEQELQNQDKNAAKPKQKSAAKKMQQMGKQMMSAMQMGEMQQMQEDVKLLRQILDNLLTFSFSQEDLMKDTKQTNPRSLQMNKVLKQQQDLKVQFKHIDDSLFAISLRNKDITENVLNEVGNVHYNVDKSLETLSQSNISKGASHQQYTLTSANKLADFLSNVQQNMMMQMQGQGSGMPKPGKGGGGDMQLPDIMQGQEKLGEKMKGEMKGDKPGNEPKDGDGGQEGDAGKVLEILKEQKQLREALQNALEKDGKSGLGQNALNQMKDIEKQLINKGFKNETLQKILNLKHELLKLEKAVQQQGEDNKRQSKTNTITYQNTAPSLPKSLQDYLNSTEILNRESLPLQPNYNKLVKEYFKKND